MALSALPARAASAALVTSLAVSIALLLMPASVWADGRRRVEERALTPELMLSPPASAPQALSAPVLSGLEFSAVAPPGVRIRIIENEPYSFLIARGGQGRTQAEEGLCVIVLLADLAATDEAPAGHYEAVVSLRMALTAPGARRLQSAFDMQAHCAYRQALLAHESRSESEYAIYEVRSPLGLTDQKDKSNRAREYLAYTARVTNPLGPGLLSEQTPYKDVDGELAAVRRAGKNVCLLSVRFKAADFPHALTLTENIARRVINQLEPQRAAERLLPYLEYYPEVVKDAPWPGEARDPRTANLAERPTESCGEPPLPIQGELRLECEQQPIETTNYQPQGVGEDGDRFSRAADAVARSVCSHCPIAQDRRQR